ncbi:MAG TPA: D-ribose pyranase [Chloroflexota bacterium]
MKRGGILNPDLADALARLGHTDALVVCDAGLPIPSDVRRIDLAVCPGVPRFLDVLRAIVAEIVVERAVVASELRERCPETYEALRSALGAVPIEEVPHERFKARTTVARAVVRTGEFTPYANVVLYAGVPF